jgi:hypothetical protein
VAAPADFDINKLRSAPTINSAQRGTAVGTELHGPTTGLPRTHPHNGYSALNDPLGRTSSRPGATQLPIACAQDSA